MRPPTSPASCGELRLTSQQHPFPSQAHASSLHLQAGKSQGRKAGAVPSPGARTRQIPELSACNPPESANSWVSIPVGRQLSEEHLAPVSVLSAAPSHIYFLAKTLLGGAGGETGSRFSALLKQDHPAALQQTQKQRFSISYENTAHK